MKILIISATSMEIQGCLNFLSKHAVQKSLSQFEYKSHTIFPYISGVGSPMMAYAIGSYKQFDTDYKVLHAGISGSYKNEIIIGSVVEVIQERWGDLGAEDKDGQTLDVFDLELCSKNQFPFVDGYLNKKNNKFESQLSKVKGLTLNRTTGSAMSLYNIKMKYQADVESMEGAAVFYACRMKDIPFVSIRAISNYVEERNKNSWKIPLALDNLNSYLVNFLNDL